MAYGKGDGKGKLKRMAAMGTVPTSAALASLRVSCLDALERMAKAAWPADVLDPALTGKELDAILLPVQSQCSKDGINNVWAEKMRLQAKEAVKEQHRRAQKNLFGRFRHVSSLSETKANSDKAPRLVNLPAEWTERLSDVDVVALQSLANVRDFRQAMALFRSLRDGNAGLSQVQADALRAMADGIRLRYGVPRWKRDDAVIQLHLDYRCVRGGKDALTGAIATLDDALTGRERGFASLRLAASVPRGEPIPLPFHLNQGIVDAFPLRDDQRLSSLLVELGPERCEAKAVVTRNPVARPVAGRTCVVAEDFGYRVTSSLAVIVSDSPIGQEAVDRVAGHNGAKDVSKVGKQEARRFLETHVAPEGVRTVETLQFDGRDFLDRIRVHATRIDTLRSEIDLNYGRMARMRREMNLVAGVAPDTIVPEECPADVPGRYRDMHGRFFRLLKGVERLKTLRRDVYRTVDGLKKAWFGFVSSRKAELAERHGAAVVREDLTAVAIPLDDPDYRGRTFNRMMNDGSKGQYIRRSKAKLEWRGIPCIRIPSFYTSTTDTRNGTVDARQRKGKGRTFVAATDGRRSDADVHAAETIGRYLFLVPKADAVTMREAA